MDEPLPRHSWCRRCLTQPRSPWGRAAVAGRVASASAGATSVAVAAAAVARRSAPATAKPMACSEHACACARAMGARAAIHHHEKRPVTLRTRACVACHTHMHATIYLLWVQLA